MRKSLLLSPLLVACLLPPSCQQQPTTVLIENINLKRGELIGCGPGEQLGDVSFSIGGSEKVKNDFNLAVKLLHSFEYDEAEKVFARIIDEQPDCAMAWWGVAMSNFHPLWAPPTGDELKKGAQAIGIARSIDTKTEKEAGYIEAIGAFYDHHATVPHRTRSAAFEKAMEKLYKKYPSDKEAAIFYALALNAAADPTDKTYFRQKKAGTILNALYPEGPDHPGIVHYIIHTYDYPELAEQALPAARQYAFVAPASAHALHMPSHIFTRLGLWDECIQSNQASVRSAQCYAQAAGIKGHWDEELHGLDYLTYSYLQKGDMDSARIQWDYLKTIREVHPANFKVAYAFAAIPARYVLENKLWKEAAALTLDTANIDWQQFPWQESIYHFARLMGAVHTNNKLLAEVELKELKKRHNTLLVKKDEYQATQVAIQIKTGEAWMALLEGNQHIALAQMREAAELESRTEKHPVTPGEVIPAMELLGDMLARLKKWEEALVAYEADLKTHPNRLNGLYGAAVAAERLGDFTKARRYYGKIVEIGRDGSGRAEMGRARLFSRKGRD
jgi:hypothetical protein